MRQADTIFALSSGRPPAGIAVIRISGPAATPAVQRLAGRVPEPRRASLSKLRTAAGELLDEALVLRFPQGASATGDDLVELHCHGGRAVVDAVLGELATIPGLREAQPGEFTRRALEHGRIDLTEAEGLADLLAAETEWQRRAAMTIAGGALRRQIESWRSRVVELSARAEAAIDYVGDEEEVGTGVSEIASTAKSLADELHGWLAQPRSEPLRQGLRVVVGGPPNAGKSSLVNALAGADRAIVTPLAGTTRDVIEVPLSLAGIAFTLVDTAGVREAFDPVERIGVELASREVAAADILLWLGSDPPDHPALIPIDAQADRDERAGSSPGALPVSSVTGLGLDVLKARLISLARTLLPPVDMVALNQRQATLVEAATAALTNLPDDLLLIAESLRHARIPLDRLTGRAGMEDVLDALFGRFCLGK